MVVLVKYQLFFALAIYTVIVFIFIWIESRRLRKNLLTKEREMQWHTYELFDLDQLDRNIEYTLGNQVILEKISDSLQKFLDCSSVAFLFMDDAGKPVFRMVLKESVNHSFVANVLARMLAQFTVLTKNQISAADVDQGFSGSVTNESNTAAISSFLDIPVFVDSQPIGLLSIASTKSRVYDSDQKMMLQTFIEQSTMTLFKLRNILSQEKDKLYSITESMVDGMFIVDTNLTLLLINSAAKDLMGIVSPAPTFSEILERLSLKTNLKNKIEESLKHGKSELEEQVTIKERLLKVFVSPIKNTTNELLGATVLFHDITSENSAEKMREDFTTMMVHELRGPLGGIRSIANLLKQEKIKNDEKKYTEFVDLLVSNSTSILALVDDLLDVSKLDAGKFQIIRKSVDVTNLITDRIKSFNSLAEENHLELVSNVQTGMPTILLDEIKMGQVLNNLLSNAIKFTPKGKITVSAFVLTAKEKLADKVAAMQMVWPGIEDISFDFDQLILAVSDTGVGIPNDQIGDLFYEYRQLAHALLIPEKKGTGLGLVISKGIVEAHLGKIGVFTEVGKGTTFYCALPLVMEFKSNFAM